MDRLTEGRKVRDDKVHRAQEEFRQLVANAYRGGVTISDIRLATRLSTATVREIIRKDQLEKEPVQRRA